MDFVDYYVMMGVPPSASEDELRQAYRTAARRFHPDVNKTSGASVLFRDINAAYEILSDPHKRSEYDKVFHDRRRTAPGLQLETFYSRRHLRQISEPQLLYVMLRIQPMLEISLTTDAPLNLCLVIDRSKSMQGARMQHVKAAAHRILDECKPSDIVSVVVFSDQAEVIVPAQHPTDPRSMKTLISAIRADGATSIVGALRSGLSQIERNRDTRYVNHLVLITDGRTYGDEEECLSLAARAREKGIGISGMGIGEDWNDKFLDALASQTGGSSGYISNPESAVRFLHERVRSLASAYAERASLIVATMPEVQIDSAVRVSPNAINLPTEPQPIALGTLDGRLATTVMLQFYVETANVSLGEFYVGRVDVEGHVLGSDQRLERVIQDLTVEVTDQKVEDEPPPELLDALSGVMLYRLQDRAREALEQGEIAEATRKLEYLATRLFEKGEEELGQAALYEARRVAYTHQLSEAGAKQLKYGTRALWPTGEQEDD